MIIREWRGRALVADAARYPEHFHRNVLPQLKRTKGFVGAQLGRRELAGKVEFLVLTRWASFDALRDVCADGCGRLLHLWITISTFSTMRCSKKPKCKCPLHLTRVSAPWFYAGP